MSAFLCVILAAPAGRSPAAPRPFPFSPSGRARRRRSPRRDFSRRSKNIRRAARASPRTGRRSPYACRRARARSSPSRSDAAGWRSRIPLWRGARARARSIPRSTPGARPRSAGFSRRDRSAACISSSLLLSGGFLQALYVQLLHLKQRLHHLVRSLPVLEQLPENFRHDLPRDAEFIFQPAALLGAAVAAFGEFLPIIVHFLLRRTTHLKRDRLVELEDRPAVERRESLPIQLEFDRQNGAGGHMVLFVSRFGVARYVENLGIFENGCVKLHRLFGVFIEPQAGRNFLHGCSFGFVQ